MCEHFIARAAEPFRLDELWPFTERLERFGLAGFGWGAGWLGRRRPARLVPRHPGVPRRPGPRDVGATETTAALVHLRRPSRLSTLTLPDTQPFDDPAGRFSFSHNGDLRDYRSLRATYRAQGRIHGRADTEVGERWLEDAWRPDEPAAPPAGRPARAVRGPGQPGGPRRRRHAPSLRGQRREPGLRLPARAGSGSCRPGSTRSIGRSSGSSRPGATDRRLVRCARRSRSDRDGTSTGHGVGSSRGIRDWT